MFVEAGRERCGQENTNTLVGTLTLQVDWLIGEHDMLKRTLAYLRKIMVIQVERVKEKDNS